MSSDQYRASDLQDDVIGWIESDDDVDAILGEDGDVLPVAIARESDADPRVSVGASISTASRGNERDDITFEVRAIVDASTEFVKSNGTGDVTALKDHVTRVITRHRAGFYEPAVQNDDEVAPSDPLNRYMGVVSATIERRETPTNDSDT